MKKSKPTKLIILDILIFVAAFVFAMSLIYLANSIKESKEQRFHKKDVQRVLTSGEYKRIIDIADYYMVIKRDTSDEMINDLYGQADYIKAAFMYNAYKNSGKDDLADECKNKMETSASKLKKYTAEPELIDQAFGVDQTEN